MANKPSNYRIWAEKGLSQDPGDAKYDLGWVVETPTHLNFNYIQKQMTQAIKYNNEIGINEWDSDTEYKEHAFTIGSDGKLYQALISNDSNDPTSTSGIWAVFSSGSAGSWDTGLEYTLGDIVSHLGAVFVALADNDGVSPETDPVIWRRHVFLSEFIAVSAGASSAGKLIKLDAAGLIDASMLDFALLTLQGPWTPTAPEEYPDTAGLPFGASWQITNVGTGYLMTTGDLAGLTLHNGEYIAYGEAAWVRTEVDFNSSLFYKLDGTQGLTAPFDAATQPLTDIADAVDPQDAVAFHQIEDNRLESLPIGSFINFGGTSAPSGYLVCDTQLLEQAVYPDLYTAIGHIWDECNAIGNPSPLTHFRLPPHKIDGLGLFLRGDSDTTVVGEYQEDAFKEHSHKVDYTVNAQSGGGVDTLTQGDTVGQAYNSRSTGDPTETRPRSITTLLCIKASYSAFIGDLGDIPVNSVGSPQIVDGAVAEVKFADGAVTKLKLNDAITSPSMAGATHVVESGHDSGGGWVKFADGTMILHYNQLANPTSSVLNVFGSTSGTAFFTDISWSFVKEFIIPPTVIVDAGVGGRALEAFTDSVGISVLHGAAGVIQIRAIAIGRWKV